MTNTVASVMLSPFHSFSLASCIVRYRFRVSCWNEHHFVENDNFVPMVFHCATNDYCKLVRRRRRHLIKKLDRLKVALCLCACARAIASNNCFSVSVCCPKRPPANHIMGWIIYKENYNLTKAKVEKYIIAIEIVFLLRERLATAAAALAASVRIALDRLKMH